MQFVFHPYAPINQQIIAHIFVTLTFLFLSWKHRKEEASLLMIFLCYERVFAFYGNTLQDCYKVIVLLFTIYVFIKWKLWHLNYKKEIWIILVFLLFAVQFFIATVFYSDTLLTTMLSQFSRYIEAFFLWFILKYAIYVRGKGKVLFAVFYDILLMAILVSIFQWLLLGSHIEGLVAGFAIGGGSHGTTLPILGYIILWCIRGGQFGRRDWLYTLGLLFLGFAAAKRAVMFILPVIIGAFMFYVTGRRINRNLALGILAVPMFFYLGVRLTPTLNPENKVWGSFDVDHVLNYAEKYQFGEDGIDGQVNVLQDMDYSYDLYGNPNTVNADGRGGATVALLKLIFGPQPLTNQDLFGIGYNKMYGVDYKEFSKLPLSIKLNHKGSSSGIFQSYVTLGVTGVFTSILFLLVFFPYCKVKRIRNVLILLVCWEYFFYTGLIIRTPAFMAMLFLVIHYMNYIYVSSRYKVNR